MKVHSFYDSANKLAVDCTECTRGRNGSDNNKCSCGHRVKRGGLAYCYVGTLIPGINVPQSIKVLSKVMVR